VDSNSAKDQLFLSALAGAVVGADDLDRALNGSFTSDPNDALLLAHWLSCEVAAASHESWWNGDEGSLLQAIGLASSRYSDGWGGRPEYPLTIHSFELLHELWPSVYERVLDEVIVPLLTHAPTALNAREIVALAREEAKTRAVAITAVATPTELHDLGTPPPLLALLGPLDEGERKRIHKLISELDWYAILVAWREYGVAPGAQAFARALVSARQKHQDPYLAICQTVTKGQWYVEPTETGVRTYRVSLRENGREHPVQGGDFDTEEDNFARALAYTDHLRGIARAHNRELALQRRENVLTHMRAFAAALELPQHPSASALAVRQAAASLNASTAVSVLRARL
jgi:hypothetical protein